MRFPKSQALQLHSCFEELIPGRMHTSGQRFLPLIVLGFKQVRLGVVDRHNHVNQAHAGRYGTARLVFQLSRVALQPADTQRMGIEPEVGNGLSTMPLAYGCIQDLITWERRDDLGYAVSYVEAIIAVGIGSIGLRTTLTGPNVAKLPNEQLQTGDWVVLSNSRIDILGFEPD